MTLRKLLAVTFLLACLATCVFAQADLSSVPRLVKFTGTAPAGTTPVTFAIYATEDGLAPLWLETQNVTADGSGHYTVLLGATKSDGLPASIFASGEARWIGVKIGEAQESQRTLLVSVPYALKAGDAETLGGKPLSAFLLSDTGTNGASGKSKRVAGSQESGRAQQEATTAVDNGGVNGTVNFLAKWSSATNITNSGVFENNGNVGIGTQSPGFQLDIQNTNAAAAGGNLLRLQTPSVNGALIHFVSTLPSGHDYGFGSNFITATGEFGIYDYTAHQPRLIIGSTGNIGVGTQTPGFQMDIQNTDASANGGNLLRIQTPSVNGALIHFVSTMATGHDYGFGSNFITATGEFGIYDYSAHQPRLIISSGGNVGIGNFNPQATLDVSGMVRGITGSFNGSTASGLVVATQTNSVVLNTDPTFIQAQTTIPGGIVGVSSATSNTAAGVAGFANSINAPAIIGWNGSTTGATDHGVGILGRSDNPRGHAIEAESSSTTGFTIGVRGESNSTDGTGVFGTSASATGNTIGVQGDVASSTGTAGLFTAPNTASAYLLRGVAGSDLFKVDGTGVVFASAYKDLAGNPIPPSGNGSNLTNLNASNLSSGTVPDARIAGTYSSTLNLSNANNTFTGASGTFAGNSANPIINVTQNGSASAIQGLHNSNGIGVFGQSSTSMGVQGNTNAGPTTFQAAVRGVSTGVGGIGVYGQSNDVSGTSIGVKGSTLSATGVAGVFDNQGGGQIISGRNAGNEKFAVNQNGVITTKSVTAASLATDTLTIAAVSFNGFSHSNDIVISQGNISPSGTMTFTNCGGVGTNDCDKGLATVLLPSGTVVSNFYVCGQDNDAQHELAGYLYRKSITDTFGAPQLL